MNMIDLPKFRIPRLTPKQVTPEVYDEWNSLNARYLAETGVREKCRQDQTRVPASEAFVILSEPL